MTTQRTCWTLIPAAGAGTRMETDTPKQYLLLAGRTVLEHTVQRFCGLDAVMGVVVVLAGQDRWWPSLGISRHEKIHTTIGGELRCHSVLNGLHYLQRIAGPDDWVMVHDAARPCVREPDIEKLITATDRCPDGAILAVPVRDTMKRSDRDGRITGTVDRENLWHALTPQIFRLSVLANALEGALALNPAVTDEAQAVELAGLRPLLVEGRPDNIKITRPSDLALAEIYLTNQERLS